MSKLPTDTLNTVLELRRENGLAATEDALYADLARSKAKWTLQATPRYRRAGRSPIWVSGKYLSSYGTCPATGEPDQGNGRSSGPAEPVATKPPVAAIQKLDETAFHKVLYGKGFAVTITKDLLSGAIQTSVPEAISKLDLQFSAIPTNATGIHVTQTSPQIQISMPLDKFLELTGIRP